MSRLTTTPTAAAPLPRPIARLITFPNGKMWPVDESNVVVATLTVELSDLIDNDLESLLDVLSERALGDPCMEEVSFRPVALSGENLVVDVTGLVNYSLEQLETRTGEHVPLTLTFTDGAADADAPRDARRWLLAASVEHIVALAEWGWGRTIPTVMMEMFAIRGARDIDPELAAIADLLRIEDVADDAVKAVELDGDLAREYLGLTRPDATAALRRTGPARRSADAGGDGRCATGEVRRTLGGASGTLPRRLADGSRERGYGERVLGMGDRPARAGQVSRARTQAGQRSGPADETAIDSWDESIAALASVGRPAARLSIPRLHWYAL
jgi:hypothetical protein